MGFVRVVKTKQITAEDIVRKRMNEAWYNESTCTLGAKRLQKRTCSNPGLGLRGDWAFTLGNDSQMGGLSYRRFPLGDII